MALVGDVAILMRAESEGRRADVEWEEWRFDELCWRERSRGRSFIRRCRDKWMMYGMGCRSWDTSTLG